MARWVNLDDCVEISAGEMRFYPVELLGDVYEEVAPVIHSNWQGVSPFVDTIECCNCGWQEISYELATRYCPDCGAKMDEEINDA